MEPQPFVPVDFDPPTSLVADGFRLEPLGERHNRANHAAWTSSIAHIRSTPGYPDGSWPPLEGISLEDNARDLRCHDADFAARRGFTFTLLDPEDGDVIGCVYLYPPEREGYDVTVQSWVRADRGDPQIASLILEVCQGATTLLRRAGSNGMEFGPALVRPTVLTADAETGSLPGRRRLPGKEPATFPCRGVGEQSPRAGRP